MATSFPDINLARVIEGANADALERLVGMMNRLFPDSGGAAIRVGSGVASFLGLDNPVSYAVGLGIEGKVNAEEIAQVVEFYRSRGAVPRVDVCPHADKSLLDALRTHDFRLHGFINVLVRPLSVDEVFEPIPAGVIVREARPAEADLWTAITDECFSDGSPITETRRQFGLLLFQGDTTVPYLAKVDGQIAAAGVMSTHGVYAALTSAAVRAPFRNRGIHTALIRTRLKKAQELGCTIAGLYAVPGNRSQRNAERHGFRVAYTKAMMKAD